MSHKHLLCCRQASHREIANSPKEGPRLQLLQCIPHFAVRLDTLRKERCAETEHALHGHAREVIRVREVANGGQK